MIICIRVRSEKGKRGGREGEGKEEKRMPREKMKRGNEEKEKKKRKIGWQEEREGYLAVIKSGSQHEVSRLTGEKTNGTNMIRISFLVYLAVPSDIN
jgi:hypothetical protein